MDINIAKNYEEFIELFNSCNKEGTEQFIKWLEKSDFKTAPASTKYHLSQEGGLCQHCLNVWKNMERYVEEFELNRECAIFVSLLCNISKVNFYELSYRNVKNKDGQWEQVPYYSVKDEANRLIFGSNAMNSYYMLSKFFKMTYDEELAIMHHNGGNDIYDSDMSRANCASAFRKSKLALALHLAETQATFVDDLVDE